MAHEMHPHQCLSIIDSLVHLLAIDLLPADDDPWGDDDTCESIVKVQMICDRLLHTSRVHPHPLASFAYYNLI